MRGFGTVLVLAVASWLVGIGAGLVGVVVLGSEGRVATAVPVRTDERAAAVLLTSRRSESGRTPTRTASSVATPTAATASGLIARVRIATIGVDAPVVVKGLDASRRMEAPDGPDEVAWYDFTALPGQGSNIVLAGHVDFAGIGPAVFWDLWRVRVGDLVELELVDGRVLRYAVTGLETVDEARAPVERIVGSTPTERLTLITCAGNYNPATGRYDQRLIVVAVPVDER